MALKRARDTQAPVPALSLDCLEEVCLRCPVDDILRLRQTCRAFKELIDKSDKIWSVKLREDYALELAPAAVSQHAAISSTSAAAPLSRRWQLPVRVRLLPMVPMPDPSRVVPSPCWLPQRASDGLAAFARKVYEASSDGYVRYQGAFVDGGVDYDIVKYWVRLGPWVRELGGLVHGGVLALHTGPPRRSLSPAELRPHAGGRPLPKRWGSVLQQHLIECELHRPAAGEDPLPCAGPSSGHMPLGPGREAQRAGGAL